MKVQIPNRANIPATNLFVEIITKNNNPLGANGRKIMMLAPGGPGGNHTVYNHIKNELLNFADLVLFDPRGCGNSDPSFAQYCTLNDYIEDIEALRQALDIKKFILLGGSYGSIAALGYATKYSSFLEKLILVSGGMADSSYLKAAHQNLLLRGTPEQIAIAEHLWNGTFKNPDHFDKFYELMAPLYLYNYKTQAQSDVPTTESRIPYNVEITNLGFSSFLRNFDFKSGLSNINCETMIIVGENDWINDLSLVEKTAQKISNCNLKVLEKCGHFVWVDQPDMFFEDMKNFITESPKATPSLSR